MDERLILAAATRSKSAFNSFLHVGVVDTLSASGRGIFDEIGEYYKRDLTSESADISIVAEVLFNAHSKNKEVFGRLLQAVSEADVSPENIQHVVVEQAISSIKLELAQALVNQSSEDTITGLLERYEDYKKGVLIPEAKLLQINLAEVIAGRNQAVFKFQTPEIDKVFGGGAPRQSHIVVFGRPEIGKSASSLSLTRANLALGHRCGYIFNEDPEIKMASRIISCLTGKTNEELQAYPEEKVKSHLEKVGYSNLFLSAGEDLTIDSVYKFVDEHELDYLIVDQVRNLNCGDGLVQILDNATKAMRSLAKTRDMAVVSITQAGDSGEGKRFLEMGDIDYSNTAVQGQCDVLMGIGATRDNLQDMGVSVIKNKLTGQHVHMNVRTAPTLSRVYDI